MVAPGHEHVDLTDELVVRRSVLATRPDAIVHAAIWNDPAALRTDRRRAWDEYVGATRNVVAAANAVDAHVVLISTDWVFDGTQGPAAETEPPNPINTYGFLKACSELIVTESAARGTIARIAGVQGIHRARPNTPRAQDAGFGYLVVSLVDALRAGERFAIWDGPGLNRWPRRRSPPTPASWYGVRSNARSPASSTAAAASTSTGWASHAGRSRYSSSTRELLDVAPPPDDVVDGGGIPRDTRLDATETAAQAGGRAARARRDAAPAAGRGRVIMERGMSRLTVAQALVRFLAVAGDRARRRGASASSPAASGSSATATSPASGRRFTSTASCCPTTRRATSRGWCTSPPATRASENRLGTFACTTSVGPGATNMVTGAALATINRLPVLLLPGDTFATRTPHPVLQQLEVPHDATVSVNDCLRPVSRFYERVERPEQLIPAALEAMRVLTDPAETGAVTLALPEDVQAEAFEVPDAFLEPRVWTSTASPRRPRRSRARRS